MDVGTVSLFFNKEPSIKWEKFNCPHCGEPTGNTNCEESENDEELQLVVGNRPYTPFSQDCFYRRQNIWEGHINYPVSRPFLTMLLKIDGVEEIGAERPYTFKVSIGLKYDEDSVIKNIERQFFNFIKTLQALETPQENPSILGIRFPNGQKFLLSPHDVSVANDLVFRSLSTEIEGSELISIKRRNKNGSD